MDEGLGHVAGHLVNQRHTNRNWICTATSVATPERRHEGRVVVNVREANADEILRRNLLRVRANATYVMCPPDGEQAHAVHAGCCRRLAKRIIHNGLTERPVCVDDKNWTALHDDSACATFCSCSTPHRAHILREHAHSMRIVATKICLDKVACNNSRAAIVEALLFEQLSRKGA